MLSLLQRVVMSVLKLRRNGHVVRGHARWGALLDEFMHAGDSLLTSPHVNKDAMTSISFGIGSLHWLVGRFNSSECPETLCTGLQLVSVIGLLSFHDNCDLMSLKRASAINMLYYKYWIFSIVAPIVNYSISALLRQVFQNSHGVNYKFDSIY